MKWGRVMYRIKRYVKVYWLLLRDSRTPRISKLMVLGAIVYLIWPFDLIPDFIPFAGFVDEFIIIPILFFLATNFIPKDVIEDNKRKAKGVKKHAKFDKNDEVQEGVIVDD